MRGYHDTFWSTVLLAFALMGIIWLGTIDVSDKIRGSTNSTGIINEIFGINDTMDKLKPYVREEREWERTHPYDHFLQDLNLN